MVKLSSLLPTSTKAAFAFALEVTATRLKTQEVRPNDLCFSNISSLAEVPGAGWSTASGALA